MADMPHGVYSIVPRACSDEDNDPPPCSPLHSCGFVLVSPKLLPLFARSQHFFLPSDLANHRQHFHWIRTTPNLGSRNFNKRKGGGIFGQALRTPEFYIKTYIKLAKRAPPPSSQHTHNPLLLTTSSGYCSLGHSPQCP